MKPFYKLLIWVYLWCVWITPYIYAVPVYTDTTFPKITVTDTAEFYKVTIEDLEGDSLFDLAYAWGTKPNVYAYVSVASDDTANWEFSHAESVRWQYIQQKTVERWDQATYNKHPLNLSFFENPFVLKHNKGQITDELDLMIWSQLKFEAEYSESLETPYIYICIDGGNYFTGEVGFSSNGGGDQRISSIYLGRFDDAVRPDTAHHFIDCVGIHELSHPFVYLPNTGPYFDAQNHYLYVTSSQSPTGKSGYFEVYDPLNYMANNQSCSRELYSAPLSQMCLGVRSKYEDTGITLYGGQITNSVFYEEWSYYDTTTSSKFFYENLDEKMFEWWNLHWNSPKNTLPSNTSEVLIPKTEQDNRSLLVFASDSIHPGYFKCFSLGANSEVSVIHNGVKTGIEYANAGMQFARISPIRIWPNPFRNKVEINVLAEGRAQSAWRKNQIKEKCKLEIYNTSGELIRVFEDVEKVVWDGRDYRGRRVKVGVCIVKLGIGGKSYVRRVMKVR